VAAELATPLIALPLIVLVVATRRSVSSITISLTNLMDLVKIFSN
jgi:hypothetical protein